jgi:hypothetical protein
MLRNAVQLICYPNRIGNDLQDLHTAINRHLSGAIGGIHIRKEKEPFHNIQFLTSEGIKLLRLDAFGYTTKRISTSCCLVEPDVYRIP